MQLVQQGKREKIGVKTGGTIIKVLCHKGERKEEEDVGVR